MKQSLKVLIIMLVALVAILPAAALAQTAPLPAQPFVFPLILGALQLVVGFVIKRWDGAVNQVIPWVTLVLSWAGYAVAPKDANAAMLVAGLIPLSMFKSLGIGLLTTLQTAAVTGTYEWIRGALLEPLNRRFSTHTMLVRRE